MTSSTPSYKQLEFRDTNLVPLLLGEQDQNLRLIESLLDVSFNARGNRIQISGPPPLVIRAEIVLTGLYEDLQKGITLDKGSIEAAIRLSLPSNSPFLENTTKTEISPEGSSEDSLPQTLPQTLQGEAVQYAITTRLKEIRARSPGQVDYIKGLHKHELVFGIGPAGTGKTYLAVAMAVSKLMKGEVRRIILSRPAVEAGEKLGFLPGDLKEKVDPYLRPLYDALEDMLPPEMVAKKMEAGEIEIAPLAFMRGRTLSNAYVILDEAQNTTTMQMKMLLTRLGENSFMVVNGDLSQVDLPTGVESGLRDAVKLLSNIDEIFIHTLTSKDVVRHRLVSKIINAYESKTKDD